MPYRRGVGINGGRLEFPELFNKRWGTGEGVGTFLINVGGVVAIPKQGVGYRSEIFEQSIQL